MHNETNYWTRRLHSARLSRRRFVGGAAVAGAGAASLALIGCGDDDDDDTGGTSPTATATPRPGETPTQAPSPTEPAGPQPVDALLRGSSANATFDTFDIDRSRFTPVAGIIAITNQAIVHYKDFNTGELEGAYILFEATLQFIGLGDPNAISWGKMVNQGRQLGGSKPLMALFTGTAITLIVVGFNLAGDALRDVLDPRLRGRGGRPGF
ncbi:MAG: hypothetical protein Kow0010_07080 [Dehalococcoidia bacterium]